jgi:4-amino-4-deoxy-L-arabinose transferase-like glycosyltransferase
MLFSRLDLNRHWNLAVIAIGLLSAAMFLIAVSQTRIDGPIRGDARDYFAYAYNIKQHGIYSRDLPGTQAPQPDALRAPAYPAMLSLLLDESNIEKTLANALYLQALLGTLTVLVYLSLFKRLMPPLWAMGAGLVTAISPHLINASVYLLTETLFTFLLGIHLLALERALRLKQVRWAVAAGVLLALNLLTRPTTQYLLLAYLLAFAVWVHRDWRTYGKYLLLLALPVIITFSAWSVRNQISTGHTSDPVLTANFLHHGMYPNMMYQNRLDTYGYPYRFDPMTAEIGGNVSKTLAAIAEHFQQEPQRYFSWYLIGKPIQFFAWNLTESVGDAFIYAPLKTPYLENKFFQLTHAIAAFLHPFLMLLSLFGTYYAISRKNLAASIFSLILLYFVALHMIGAPFPRYSIPLRPINYGLAFFALYQITQWSRTKLNPST